jgi:hypothetical protein
VGIWRDGSLLARDGNRRLDELLCRHGLVARAIRGHSILGQWTGLRAAVARAVHAHAILMSHMTPRQSLSVCHATWNRMRPAVWGKQPPAVTARFFLLWSGDRQRPVRTPS